MNTVTSWREMKRNIRTLESYRKSPGKKHDYYLDLIKKGICFIAYEYYNKIHFAPSRFIGYQENSISKRQKNGTGYGGDTNYAISNILEETPRENGRLEFHYKFFCQELGITPNETGTGGNTRKFWISPEKKDSLNEIFNFFTEDKKLLDDLKDIENQKDIKSTDKWRLVSARMGQGWFRKELIKIWKGCAVTKCNEITILRASHIKPWSSSNNKEKLDVYNGLLLIPNLDLLFDKGFISFKENGEIIISKKIKKGNMGILGVNANMKIAASSRHVRYLKWHRENIFRK